MLVSVIVFILTNQCIVRIFSTQVHEKFCLIPRFAEKVLLHVPADCKSCITQTLPVAHRQPKQRCSFFVDCYYGEESLLRQETLSLQNSHKSGDLRCFPTSFNIIFNSVIIIISWIAMATDAELFDGEISHLAANGRHTHSTHTCMHAYTHTQQEHQ